MEIYIPEWAKNDLVGALIGSAYPDEVQFYVRINEESDKKATIRFIVNSGVAVSSFGQSSVRFSFPVATVEGIRMIDAANLRKSQIKLSNDSGYHDSVKTAIEAMARLCQSLYDAAERRDRLPKDILVDQESILSCISFDEAVIPIFAIINKNQQRLNGARKVSIDAAISALWLILRGTR